MRKIILAMLAVLAGITLSYAESCSSGQGSLSYQISGCGEQSRACCTGQWCSWGTSSCASCTATSTTNSRNCSGNVSGACAGTQTQSCTRSVTASCGSSCSYSSWSCGSWTGSCTYTQSCTATSSSTACSNVSGSYCSGTAYRYRSVSGSCGSCSYSGWGSWQTGGCTSYVSCTATTDSTACSNVSSSYCQGTAYRYRSVNSSCGSCSYSGWSGWDTGGCGSFVLVGCLKGTSSHNTSECNFYYSECGGSWGSCSPRHCVVVNVSACGGKNGYYARCDFIDSERNSCRRNPNCTLI